MPRRTPTTPTVKQRGAGALGRCNRLVFLAVLAKVDRALVEGLPDGELLGASRVMIDRALVELQRLAGIEVKYDTTARCWRYAKGCGPIFAPAGWRSLAG